MSYYFKCITLIDGKMWLLKIIKLQEEGGGGAEPVISNPLTMLDRPCFITRAIIDQVDATLFVEQRLNNLVIKVQEQLLNSQCWVLFD